MNKQRPPHGIEWVRVPRLDGTRTDGYTWNPVAGCFHACVWLMLNPTRVLATTRASCYAGVTAGRLAAPAYPEGFAHHYWRPDLLSEPLKVQQPAGIFISSMGDLMGAWPRSCPCPCRRSPARPRLCCSRLSRRLQPYLERWGERGARADLNMDDSSMLTRRQRAERVSSEEDGNNAWPF
jgi:hypothetical protein